MLTDASLTIIRNPELVDDVLTRTRRRAALAALAGAALAAWARGDEPPPSVPPPGDALSPLVAQALVPLLAEWIIQSRDAALAKGVEPISAAIRADIEGYVPQDVSTACAGK